MKESEGESVGEMRESSAEGQAVLDSLRWLQPAALLNDDDDDVQALPRSSREVSWKQPLAHIGHQVERPMPQ